jgi:ABC-type sugar transport system substrate-binding protein
LFEPFGGDLEEEIVEIVADGKQLALSLWVPAGLGLPGLEFLLDASAA